MGKEGLREEIEKAREALRTRPMGESLEEAARWMEAALSAPRENVDAESLTREILALGALLQGVEWELDLRARWLVSQGVIEPSGYDGYRLTRGPQVAVEG